MNPWPIGVFASLDAGLGVKLEVAQELGVPTIQLHAPSAAVRTREQAEAFLKRLRSANISLTAVFGGFEGESYADIPTTSRTVGLVPPATRAARLREMKEISDFAKVLGCEVIALHLGFIPHEEANAGSTLYREIIDVTRDLCDHAKNNGQSLHLETGQETADGLLQFISDVRRHNLFINFDPANMILYDMGEPVSALERLAPYVRQLHFKDAVRTKVRGEWGTEVPVGTGEVDWRRLLRVVEERRIPTRFMFEREAGEDRVGDLAQGLGFVKGLLDGAI